MGVGGPVARKCSILGHASCTVQERSVARGSRGARADAGTLRQVPVGGRWRKWGGGQGEEESTQRPGVFHLQSLLIYWPQRRKGWTHDPHCRRNHRVGTQAPQVLTAAEDSGQDDCRAASYGDPGASRTVTLSSQRNMALFSCMPAFLQLSWDGCKAEPQIPVSS